MLTRTKMFSALLAALLAVGARAADLAIVGVTVIDVAHLGRSAQDLADATIIVHDGIIMRIGRRGQVKLPAGAKVIVAKGAYVVPGLIDGFGSLRTQGFADAYLYEGVTTVYVNKAPAGADGEQAIAVTQGGPRLILGAAISGRTRDGARSAAELAGEIERLADGGARGITIGLDVDEAQFDAILAAAKRRGLAASAEPGLTSYPHAIFNGVSTLLRNDHYLTALASADQRAAFMREPTGAGAGPAYRAICQLGSDAPELQALGTRLAKAHTALMPMLSIEATADDVGASNPWLSRSSAFVRASDLDDPVDAASGARPYLVSHADRREALRACAMRRQQADAQLHRMGVPYLAGSGAPGFGIMPGGGLHQELQLLQQIGLTPREALAAATGNFAQVYGWQDVGLVAVGRAGDLLVLGSDPRLDVAALADLHAVIQGGQLVDRERLHARAAPALLREALAAQGGEQALRALKSVQWQAKGYRNMVEQSERPAGPYLTEFDTIAEVHDFAGGRYRRTVDGTVFPFGPFSSGIVFDNSAAMRTRDDSKTAATPQLADIARERLALSPERLLLTALDAADVHREADQLLQEVPQNVLAFSLHKAPVRIFLNAYTHLPTAVDYAGPLARTGFWSFLGDVTLRTYYSFWWLAKGGIHYPMQWNMESNGLPDGMLHIHALRIDEALADASLDIPDSVRAAYDPQARPTDRDATPLGQAGKPAQELAPGIVFIPGEWNATIIRQDDGIVILEAPIASGYALKVLAEARRRFPDVPVKAVITTSDAWPHLAGVRQFVAEGIPVYALDLNRPILERVINAAYTSRPDALQATHRKADLRLVGARMVLGTGVNRLEIVPIRGETSERQLMVYFPQHRLLYGSDAFQRDDKGVYFYPQTMAELADAVTREQLGVDQFFMMHVDPTPWSEVAKAIAHARADAT